MPDNCNFFESSWILICTGLSKESSSWHYSKPSKKLYTLRLLESRNIQLTANALYPPMIEQSHVSLFLSELGKKLNHLGWGNKENSGIFWNIPHVNLTEEVLQTSSYFPKHPWSIPKEQTYMILDQIYGQSFTFPPLQILTNGRAFEAIKKS